MRRQQTPAPGLLQPIEPPEGPAQRWHIDLVSMAKSNRGNGKLCVAVDALSRWVEAAPLPDASATTVAEFVLERIFLRHGTPLQLHSDQGKEFENQLVKRLAAVVGTRKTATTAYHPQGNGLCERAHRPLVEAIAKYCSADHKDWDLYVQAAVFAHNAAPHSATGEAPYFVMTGRQPVLGIDLELGNVGAAGQRLTAKEAGADAARRLQRALPIIRESIRAAQEGAKERYDKSHTDLRFTPGQEVLLNNGAADAQPGTVRKLLRPWQGPYKVIGHVHDNPLVVRIQSLAKPSDIQNVNIQRLKPFYRLDARLADGGVAAAREAEQQDDAKGEVSYIYKERDSIEHPGTKDYWVKWRNMPRRFNTWINEKDLNAPLLLDKFHIREAARSGQPHKVQDTAPVDPVAPNPPVQSEDDKKGRNNAKPQTLAGQRSRRTVRPPARAY
jgi:hypothetical protein